MKLIPELLDILEWDKPQLQKELGVSRATLHRWETKGMPPVVTVGNTQRLQKVVAVAWDRLQGVGEIERAAKLYHHLSKVTRDSHSLYEWRLTKMPHYTHDTVLPLRPIIAQARQLWTDRCAEYFAAGGAHGTCVVGAGFYLSFLPDGAKKPRAWMFLSADSVTPAQGASNWEHAVEEVHQFLKDNGVQCEYDWGRMD